MKVDCISQGMAYSGYILQVRRINL